MKLTHLRPVSIPIIERIDNRATTHCVFTGRGVVEVVADQVEVRFRDAVVAHAF